MRYAEIVGWGKAMPEAVLTNSHLERLVDTNDEWITTRTGISERRISHVDVSVLGSVAAEHALAAAGVSAEDIDLVILATSAPETIVPATAAHVQRRIGAWNAGAFDLNANCSSFLYGMVVGSDLVKTGSVDRVLLVGAERLSMIVDYTDRATCILFGDGAGAVVLSATDQPYGVMASSLGNDGRAAEHLCAPSPLDPHRNGNKIFMNGQEVFRRAVTKMGEAAEKVISDVGWTVGDIDLLVPHQANRRIIDATTRRLGIDDDHVFINVHRYGNTSAATIPVALTEALEEGRIAPHANVVMAAFGGGLSWGAAAINWGERVEPIARSDAALPAFDGDVMDLIHTMQRAEAMS